MNTQNTQTNPQANPNNEQSVLSRSLLNVLLVFLESAITLVLRFDPKLRELAYPLASQDKLVCIRSYLPHTQIYATFGYQGVLLDDRIPPNKTHADITINAYSFQLFNVLTNHSPKAVEALQIRGNAEDVAMLKAFLVQLGVGGMVQNLLTKMRGKEKPTPEERAQKQENYKAKIAELDKQLAELSKENSRLTTALAEAQSKQKTTKTALIVASLIAIIAVILHFF